MSHKVLNIVRGAISNPVVAFRFACGLDPSEIPKKSINKFFKKWGISPAVIVEAGAYDGSDTAEFLEIWPSATVHSFEPLEQLFTALQTRFENSPSVHLYPYALSDSVSNDQRMFTYSTNDQSHGSSSILEPTLHTILFPQIPIASSVAIRTTTLDLWAHEHLGGVVNIDLLWLDVQGLEEKVLLAGFSALARTRVIHIEVSRKPLYKGAALYKDIDSLLKSAGFKRVITRIPAISGNALYVRK